MQHYTPEEYSISEIINGCINGSRKMQQLLYDRFAAKMFHICLRYTTNNIDDAKDILQEGFIKVFKNLNRFRNDGSFEGWIRTIVTRTALSYLKEKGKKVNNHDSSIGDMVKDTETSIEDRLAEKYIISMIKQLPPGYQKIFTLYAIDGYNHRQISVILNCSEGTSKSQLCRSKTRLQEMLRKTA